MKATMTAVKRLMKTAGTGFLATTNGRRPTVRPMSAYLWVGGELWLAAFLKSEKVCDAGKCRTVEFCAMQSDFRHVRIAGRVALSRSAADKKKMFAAYEWMGRYFTSATDPNWVVMKIRPTRIRLMGVTDMQYYDVKLAQ